MSQVSLSDLCIVQFNADAIDSLTEALEPIWSSAGHGPQIAVHFRRRRAEDEVADCPFGDLDVLIRAQNVNLLVGQDNPSLGHILDSELCPSALTSQPADGSVQVVTWKQII